MKAGGGRQQVAIRPLHRSVPTGSSMTEAGSRGEAVKAISNGLVRLQTSYYGKGPTQIKTHISGELVVSLHSGGFTKVEETLIAAGHGPTVAELRRAVRESMERELIEVVEEATSRAVVTYLSQVHTASNVSVELFVLAPDGKADAEAD